MTLRYGDGLEMTLSEGSAIPDSVVYQYDLINGWSQGNATVPNSGNAAGGDMSLTGDFQTATLGGESGAESDGTDDHGLADGPQSAASNETYGFAFTTALSSPDNDDTWFGQDGSGGDWHLYTTTFNGGTLGAVAVWFRDSNSNITSVNSTTAIDDGSVHAVVINKTGDAPSDFDFYIDDMSSATGTQTISNSGFNSADYTSSVDMGFWARNNQGTMDRYLAAGMGVVEFKTSPYSQTERDGFVSRRPEV